MTMVEESRKRFLQTLLGHSKGAAAFDRGVEVRADYAKLQRSVENAAGPYMRDLIGEPDATQKDVLSEIELVEVEQIAHDVNELLRRLEKLQKRTNAATEMADRVGGPLAQTLKANKPHAVTPYLNDILAPNGGS